ncbi:MAG: type II secretion system protein [bacterium]
MRKDLLFKLGYRKSPGFTAIETMIVILVVLILAVMIVQSFAYRLSPEKTVTVYVKKTTWTTVGYGSNVYEIFTDKGEVYKCTKELFGNIQERNTYTFKVKADHITQIK